MFEHEMTKYYDEIYRYCYRRRYLEKMNLFLQLLYDKRGYTSVIGYSTDLLKRFPHSVEIRYWLVPALWELREPDVVKSAIDTAKEILMNHEWSMFTEPLRKESGK